MGEDTAGASSSCSVLMLYSRCLLPATYRNRMLVYINPFSDLGPFLFLPFCPFFFHSEAILHMEERPTNR